MLHRIREACGRGGFVPKDVVEVGEPRIGGRRRNMSNGKRKALAGTGRGVAGKMVVAGMRERDGNKRLPRARRIRRDGLNGLSSTVVPV